MATAGKTITCKAAVAWAAKKPHVIEDIEVAPPKDGEVRIKVIASGVCHSDIHAHLGELDSKFPMIFGHEGAGIVESVGPGVTTVKAGDKVLTFVFAHCRECRNCKNEQFKPCLKNWTVSATGVDASRSVMEDGTSRFSCKGKTIYHFLGSSTFTEYTVMQEYSVGKLPDDAPLEKVFPYACAVPTGYGASTQAAKVTKGSNVVIWGLGGVGLCAVLGAKDAQAGRIIGVDINPSKFEIAKKLGCTECINPLDHKKPIAEVLNAVTGMQVDYIIVCVGIPAVMEAALQTVTLNAGTVVAVGIAHGKVGFAGLNFLYGAKVLGCCLGNFRLRDDVPKLIDRYIEGKINTDPLITGTYKLEDIDKTFALLGDSKCLRSVILL